MRTTVEIKDDAYNVVIKKQSEIFDKTGKRMKINKIVEDAILNGIDLVGEE